MDPVRYKGILRENDVIAIAGTEIRTYDVPHRLAEQLGQDTGIRTSPLRGMGQSESHLQLLLHHLCLTGTETGSALRKDQRGSSRGVNSLKGHRPFHRQLRPPSRF